MITNTSSIGPGATPGPDPRRSRPAAPGAPAAGAGAERLSTEHADRLRESLAGTPAVRPEEVRRAAALAVDPKYPPLEIIERVASLLARSQDLSEEKD